ncbi:hypothetical protein ABTX34_16980 [Streptomyces sp. NPDC096538]|uniref:hypothetical protein n=1 Tax=Streptomyces TaxID=1883 RepID=UPI00331FECA8
MSVGFRATPEDNEIIRAHKRPEESTSDVLRRALRALDREAWQQQARADMERIAASGEDLSEEPDDWGFDEDGKVVDLRTDVDRPAAPSEPPAIREALAGLAAAGHVLATGHALATGSTRSGRPDLMVPDELVGRASLQVGSGRQRRAKLSAVTTESADEGLPAPGDPAFRTLLAVQAKHRRDLPRLFPATPGSALWDACELAAGGQPPTPPKLARLRAAAARKARTR